MKDGTLKAIAAMVCITGLEISAIVTGLDGSILSLVIAALAGLGGYAIGQRKSD